MCSFFFFGTAASLYSANGCRPRDPQTHSNLQHQERREDGVKDKRRSVKRCQHKDVRIALFYFICCYFLCHALSVLFLFIVLQRDLSLRQFLLLHPVSFGYSKISFYSNSQSRTYFITWCSACLNIHLCICMYCLCFRLRSCPGWVELHVACPCIVEGCIMLDVTICLKQTSFVMFQGIS